MSISEVSGRFINRILDFIDIKLKNVEMYKLRRLIKRIIKFFLIKDFVYIKGYKLYLDKKDSLSLSLNPNYETEHFKIMDKYIKKGGTVIDIGANIGYFTIYLSKLVGKYGKVIAFEPDVENFNILNKNIEENNCMNIITEQTALSDIDGHIKIYQSKFNAGDHRTYDSGDKRKSYDIKTIKLCSYMKDKINFIKMDIQGFEYFALKGMGNILKQDIVILTELWSYGFRKSKTNIDEYFNLIYENGFKTYILEKDGSLSLRNKEQMQKYMTYRWDDFYSLLLMKNNGGPE